MRLLGKIILFLSICMPLFAKVEAYLERNVVNAGEPAVLILKAKGKDVVFPQIDDISGYEVSSRNTRQSTSYINGKFSQELERIYTFYPTADVDIPSFKISVAGKEELTKPLHVKIKNPTSSNGQEPFEVDVKVSNTTPFVGELIRVDVLFKRDASKRVAQLQLVDPQFDGFWVKGSKTYDQTMQGEYVVHKASYWMWASRTGKVKIEPITVNVGIKNASRDVFNMFMENVSWHRVRSTPTSLEVKELPSGVVLVGDFSLKVQVDKNEVDVGKPVNVTVEIRGKGNLDDVPTINLNAKDAVVFRDKPNIKAHIDGDDYRGVWEQKFALSPSRDTLIEAIKVPYFNLKTKRVEYLTSELVSLHVKGSLPSLSTANAPLNAEKTVIKQTRWDYVLYAFLGGLFLGVLGILGVQKSLHVKPKFTFAKNNKELLKELLRHKGKDIKLDEWIEKLEQNCYGGKNHAIARKEIEKLIKSCEG